MKTRKVFIVIILGFIAQFSLGQQFNDKSSNIHDAAAIGNLEKVKELIEADPSLLELRDKDGYTPLNKACRGVDPDRNLYTQVEVANYLLDKGADVNTKDNGGLTPLMQVYVSSPDQKYYDLMQRLISMGADVNASMKGRNWTKIMGAIAYDNVKVARLLIYHGANINIRDIEGTALQKAINNFPPIDNEQKIEMGKLLVKSGAKLQEFSFGNNELHLAAIRGFTEIVPTLVKYGADVNSVNDYGHTPLFYAARHGYRKTAEALIAVGADKSTIVETNYGKAPQLSKTLKEGEAWLWYLTCHTSPRIGYAVKTQNHLLIFNPSRIIESQETGLANGYLNPKELADQNITVLNCYETPLSGSQPDIFKLKQAMPDANFILNVQTTDNDTGNSDVPSYHKASANESFSLDGIQVHTIPACQSLFGRIKVLGYLVEADGMKIFHAGLHAPYDWKSQKEQYEKEIGFLKPFGPIDIAILPISGRHITIDYEAYLHLIDQLSPKAIYLIGEELNTEEHLKCIEVLKKRDVPVYYPDGAIAIGQRFHYLRK